MIKFGQEKAASKLHIIVIVLFNKIIFIASDANVVGLSFQIESQFSEILSYRILMVK